MSRLASIAAKPTLKQFAQGIAQESIQPVADFIAPTVSVGIPIGYYKQYDEKSRFRIPDTRRAIGGRATEIRFAASDATYNCQAHALDYPVDNLEAAADEGLEDVFKEGAVAVAEVAGLAHEKTVVDAALAAVGAGTGKVWNDAADPIADLDASILDIVRICAYGSSMGVGVLFGANAWQIFKNQAKVRGRFIAGASPKGGTAFAVPTEENARALLIGHPEIRTSYMVADSAAEGLTRNLQFLLASSILIFARKANPTRRDPSFMKTFRLSGKFMVPGTYSRDDGRVEVAKFDWSEDVKVTNSAAAIRLNVATA